MAHVTVEEGEETERLDARHSGTKPGKAMFLGSGYLQSAGFPIYEWNSWEDPEVQTPSKIGICLTLGVVLI